MFSLYVQDVRLVKLQKTIKWYTVLNKDGGATEGVACVFANNFHSEKEVSESTYGADLSKSKLLGENLTWKEAVKHIELNEGK